MKQIILILFMLTFTISTAGALTVLKIENVRSKALDFNRTYLSAKQDVIKAGSEITTARSSALPELSLNAYYDRNFQLPSFFVNVDGQDPIEFKTGFNNSFGASISLKQSIWQGGKVFNAYKIAKQYKKYAEAGSGTVKAEVINSAEVLYFAAILAQSNLEVIQKAIEAANHNFDIVEIFLSQGQVAEYELLRAKVEKANLLPMLINSESEVILSGKRLKSFIGIDLDEEILLEDYNDSELINLPQLDSLLRLALNERPELRQAKLFRSMTKKAISIARADYFPSLEAVSTYSWASQSDRFTLNDNEVKSWSAGVRLSFPIFNGGATKGMVRNYTADHQQAQLAYRDTEDIVRLQVEETFDLFQQALKALDIQKETIAQAEEGLRIANLRYESGVGIQLEVLSAQSALTSARNAKAQAVFNLRKVKSDLKKVTTIEIN